MEQEKLDAIAAVAALCEHVIYEAYKNESEPKIPQEVLALLREFRFKKDIKLMAKTLQYLARDLFYVIEEETYLKLGEYPPYEPADAWVILMEFLSKGMS